MRNRDPDRSSPRYRPWQTRKRAHLQMMADVRWEWQASRWHVALERRHVMAPARKTKKGHRVTTSCGTPTPLPASSACAATAKSSSVADTPSPMVVSRDCTQRSAKMGCPVWGLRCVWLKESTQSCFNAITVGCLKSGREEGQGLPADSLWTPFDYKPLNDGPNQSRPCILKDHSQKLEGSSILAGESTFSFFRIVRSTLKDKEVDEHETVQTRQNHRCRLQNDIRKHFQMIFARVGRL